jgi:hypothetical protein
MTDSRREIDSEKSTLRSYLSERFASDDQILSRLPGLVSQIVTDPEISEDEKSIEQWCKAIISFQTAEIKARVDTVYLTSVSGILQDEEPVEPEEDLKERKVALQAELEELHSEIASVAEMVVEHDIRKPMTGMKERKDRERTQARTAWLNYVSITISYRNAKLTPTGAFNTRVHEQTPPHSHDQHTRQR